MKFIKEITDEDWAQLMDNVEKALGRESVELIMHRITTLEGMLLHYQLEQEEESWEIYTL